MATAMITSTPTKDKKKNTSPSKQKRSNVSGTLKRNPKYELKKEELIQLLGRFEAELQAKDIALATLKSEKVKSLLSNARFGRLSCQTDPYGALLRDSEYVKEDVFNEQIPMKNAYETQLVQLEELIIQQRKQVQTLKIALDDAEHRIVLLAKELENEKKEKNRLQTFSNQLIIVQEEKYQLRNELENAKIYSQELEKQLSQMTQLLEHEHERHKKFVVFIVNERKAENEHYKKQIKQLTNNHVNDDSQRDTKFKELEIENEKNKQVLTARINQLQNEIDLLVKEKKTNISSPDIEVAEIISKPQSKLREALPSTNNSSPPPPAPPPATEKPSNGGIRRPTVIPTSAKNGTTTTKSNVVPPSVTNRTQSSVPELPASPVPTVAKRNAIPTRSIGNVSPSPIASNLRSSPSNSQSSSSSIPINNSTTGTNVTRGGIPRLTKNPHQIVKPTTTSTTAPAKRSGQTSISSEHKIDDLRSLLETIYSVTENRLTSSTDVTDPLLLNDNNYLNSSSSHSELILFRAAENGDTDQLVKLLKLGSNPNIQMSDGNTCLHLSTSTGHIECIRYLLKYGANPYLENNLGLTSWNNLSKLSEILQLECLQLFVDLSQLLPPVDLIFNSIELNHTSTYGYLLSILHEELKVDSSNLSRLLKTALRSSNTHFLECLFAIIPMQEFIQLVDPHSFISNECLQVLSTLDNEQLGQLKPLNLLVRIVSSPGEHRYSYAIGTITLIPELSWLELERSCVKIFMDHITQIDSPFDYIKSSIGCTANHIDTITLGLTKWHYQDSPNDQSSLPFMTARERDSITIQLKGIEMNTTESLAYNYFIPSQTLKSFIHYIEQNPFVGVYGAAHLQKKSLFEDLVRCFERPTTFSTSPKFKVIKFEFESVTSLDDCIDELVHHDFFRTRPWAREQQSVKYLLLFSNIQNSVGTDMLNLLFNSETMSDSCQQLIYSKEEDTKSLLTYYFPSIFHIFLTMSKRTWSTEHEIYKKFKWIPFKIDNVPWNGLLKRHLWRRMIDTNLTENRPVDNELIQTLQWITNVWQRYNECLQKLSLQNALLGPALFFDCPMEREAIFEWLQNKWNTIVAPLVRELSMNKCAQPKSKSATSATAAATTIASALRANSLEISTPYESVACTTLYVLLHRAVSRDCPLTGQEREQYLLNFIGSRLEGGGSSSMMSSAASSRASTPQPSNSCDFISIQLE